MKRSLSFWTRVSLGFLVTLLLFLSRAEAQSFFEGKVVRIIIPFSAGGGYDTYGRIIARHMKQYIPGNPEIIVQNIPGGGGLRAANFLYRSVKPDGLTIGLMSRDIYFTQFTEQTGVMYDMTKFIPLGSATFDNRVVFVRTDVARTLDELKAVIAKGKEVFVGATGVADTGYNLWKIVETLVPGIKVQYVLGYPGAPEVHLAIAKGEVMAHAQSKSGLLEQGKSMYNAGKLSVIVQTGTADKKRDPDFPNAHTFWELVKTNKQKALVSVSAAASIAGRPLFLPAGVPQDRVKVLREAFRKVGQDPKAIAEGKKLNRPIEYVTPEAIEEVYRDIFSLSADDRKEITKLFTEK